MIWRKGVRVTEPKYRCPDCGHVCTEGEMEGDAIDPDDWTNHVCPACHAWMNCLEEWDRVDGAEGGADSDPPPPAQ
jgi:peptide subunit release factor 1 (eRF1)